MLSALAIATLLLSAESDFGDDYDKKLVLLGHYDLLFERRNSELAARVLTREILIKIKRWLETLPMYPSRVAMVKAGEACRIPVGALVWQDKPIEINVSFERSSGQLSLWLGERKPCEMSLGGIGDDFPLRVESQTHRDADIQNLFGTLKQIFERAYTRLDGIAYRQEHPNDTKAVAEHLLDHMEMVNPSESEPDKKGDLGKDEDDEDEDEYEDDQDGEDFYTSDEFWFWAAEIIEALSRVTKPRHPFKKLAKQWRDFDNECEEASYTESSEAQELWEQTVALFKKELAS
jgi:hypothetical protein